MSSLQEQVMEEMRDAYELTRRLAGKAAADMVLGVMLFSTSMKDDVSQAVMRKHFDKVMEIILTDFAEWTNAESETE